MYIYMCIYIYVYVCVAGVMKMGNIVAGTEIEPTSLAFRASVLTITSPRLPDVTTILMPTCLCCSLPERSVQSSTYIYNTFIYVHISVYM